MPPRARSFEETAHRRRFGDRVRQLRTERGWSQELLAEKAELHRTYVVEVERGHRNASLDVIEALAVGLAVGPAELFRDGPICYGLSRRASLSEARTELTASPAARPPRFVGPTYGRHGA